MRNRKPISDYYVTVLLLLYRQLTSCRGRYPASRFWPLGLGPLGFRRSFPDSIGGLHHPSPGENQGTHQLHVYSDFHRTFDLINKISVNICLQLISFFHRRESHGASMLKDTVSRTDRDYFHHGVYSNKQRDERHRPGNPLKIGDYMYKDIYIYNLYILYAYICPYI